MLADRVRTGSITEKVDTSLILHCKDSSNYDNLISEIYNGYTVFNTWKDYSGNNNHMIQPIQPKMGAPTTLGQSLDTSQFMYSTFGMSELTGNKPRTIIIEIFIQAQGNIFGYGVGTEGAMVDGYVTGLKFGIHAYGTGFDNISIAPTITLNQMIVLTLRYDGTRVVTSNGNIHSSPLVMALNTGTSPFYINKGIYQPLDGAVRGVYKNLKIYNRYLSDAELATVISSL